MHKRKIQLIANSTYSISLPKDWIIKNKLKKNDTIMISEKNDSTLILSPSISENQKLNEIILQIEDFPNSINRILYVCFYLGIQTITLKSKKEFSKDQKTKIRKSLSQMSGSEITYEDKSKIIISVFLDQNRLDLRQIIFRTGLLIESMIESIIEKPNIKEINLNEVEIDRLYHLSTKIISLSLININVLNTSKIKNISMIPSYFLICKKLENIGDNLSHLANHINQNKINSNSFKEILELIKNELSRSIKHINADFPRMFEKISDDSRYESKNYIYQIKDKILSDYLKDTLRFVKDIEDEIVQLSFTKQLLEKGNL